MRYIWVALTSTPIPGTPVALTSTPILGTPVALTSTPIPGTTVALTSTPRTFPPKFSYQVVLEGTACRLEISCKPHVLNADSTFYCMIYVCFNRKMGACSLTQLSLSTLFTHWHYLGTSERYWYLRHSPREVHLIGLGCALKSQSFKSFPGASNK